MNRYSATLVTLEISLLESQGLVCTAPRDHDRLNLLWRSGEWSSCPRVEQEHR